VGLSIIFIVLWSRVPDHSRHPTGCDLFPTKQFVAFLLWWLIVSGISLGAIFWGLRLETYEDVQSLRLGSMTHSSVFIFGRQPDATVWSVVYRPAENDTADWSYSRQVTLSGDTDYTAVVNITDLEPDTTYDYAQMVDGDMGEIFQFTTFPLPLTPSKYRFHFGSCFLVNFPVGEDLRGYEKVLAGDPRFSLFLGDFIYADHPYFLNDHIGTFRKLYRGSIDNSHYREAATIFPTFYTYDDHEIKDNWDQGRTGAYLNAIDVWWEYAGRTNPRSYSITSDILYYNFWYGDTAFFVIDERSYRSRNNAADGPDKTILGAIQFQELKDWLIAVNTTAKIKFIGSGIAWSADQASTSGDSWKGFLYERNLILDFIQNNSIANVILLSGDVHFAFAVEVRPQIYEFSVSPIQAFPDDVTPPFVSNPTENVSYVNSDMSGASGGAVTYTAFMDVDTTLAQPTVKFSVWFNSMPETDAVDYSGTFTYAQI